MDLTDYWQENKRFILTVLAGLLVFFIGILTIESVYGSEIASVRRSYAKHRADRDKAYYTKRDLQNAQEVHDELRAAIETLQDSVAFQPREEFRIAAGGASPSNQYFGRVDRVRQDLATLASRNRLKLPEGLGLEMLKTTREEIIERHLEALDVIDRVVRFAIESRVRRIDRIQVRLDPALDSRTGLGNVEKTKITFSVTSSAESVVGLLALSQSDRHGKPLAIDSVEVSGARAKEEEVRAEIVFLVVRLPNDGGDEEVEG